MRHNILIADDEESIRFTFAEFLRDEGYRVETVDSLTNCFDKMQQEAFDLLYLDIGFGTENSIAAIQRLKSLQPDCSIVMITGSPGVNTMVEAKKYGAVDYLVKPVHQASLLYNTKKVLTR